jgi:hypothetical protein
VERVSKDNSSLRTVQLSSDGIIHKLVVDGIDLSRGLRGAQLSLAAGELPTLTVDPIIYNLDGADLGTARVVVTDQAAKALVALGWTPPEEAE